MPVKYFRRLKLKKNISLLNILKNNYLYFLTIFIFFHIEKEKTHIIKKINRYLS